jgi:CRP/FNR family cyclic AMP-dependent transcriptional regulator
MAEHPFLQGLSPHQARLLNDCAMFTMFEPGELIFRQGDPASRFYLILRGEVALESRAVDGQVTPIDIITGGEVLGWSWLLPPYLWHFDARAVERTEAVSCTEHRCASSMRLTTTSVTNCLGAYRR